MNVKAFLCVAALLAVCSHTLRAEQAVIEIGDRLELFVDHYLVDQMQNARLQQHEMMDRGVVMAFDAPWEGPFSGYVTILHDGDVYRMYYRGGPQAAGPKAEDAREVTCYAESKDGIHWTRPSLGLHEANGTKENNIILAYPNATTERTPAHNFSPMLDENPHASADERYKALGGTNEAGGLFAYASADGIHWRKMREESVLTLTGWVLDSQNVSFWSAKEQKYLLYYRHVENRFRSVARSESANYLDWPEGQLMVYNDTGSTRPRHQLYTSQTQPYFRAPHLYIATPARFVEGQQVITQEEAEAIGVHPRYFGDTSDSILLTSRDGYHYDHALRGPLVRPGIGPNNWVSRTNYPALNVVQTGEHEMSLYVIQDYGQPTAHLHRHSIRLDGFGSIRAEDDGGEMRTKPLRFEGDRLLLNVATSAAGALRVEIQDASGKPVPGFALDDCADVVGNDVERVVRWQQGADVSSLAGQTVRLRFVLKDADLYAFRFQHR